MTDELATLRAENERLRDRVEWLEMHFAGAGIPINPRWGLSGKEAQVFQILYAAHGIVERSQILAALYDGRDEPGTGVTLINVFVCHLRRKLNPFGIKIMTQWGMGYYLDDASRKQIKAGAA